MDLDGRVQVVCNVEVILFTEKGNQFWPHETEKVLLIDCLCFFISENLRLASWREQVYKRADSEADTWVGVEAERHKTLEKLKTALFLDEAFFNKEVNEFDVLENHHVFSVF